MNTVSRDELIRRIKALPQGRFIPEERMHRWLDGVALSQPGREAWLVERLAGIGGSEIGVLVGERANMYDPFSSGRYVVADKLLLNEPEMPSPHMTRGTVLEPIIAQVFLDKYSAVRDDDALEKIGGYAGDSQHPWLIGNPDDVVLIDGARYLVDYKCPKSGTAAVYDSVGIPFGYTCQLHHYQLIARRVGIDFDGLILAPFDTDIWDVLAQEVPYDPALDLEVLRCGDLYWDEYVLKGELPELADNSREILYPEDLPENIHEVAETFANINVLANTAYREADKRKEQLVHLLEPYQLAIRQRIPIGAVNVDGTEKQEYDVEAMCAELEARKVPIDDCIAKTEYSPEKLYAKLETLQKQATAMDLTAYLKPVPGLKVALSRARKGPIGEHVQTLRGRANLLVSRVIEQVVQPSQSAPELPEDAPKLPEPTLPAEPPVRSQPIKESGLASAGAKPAPPQQMLI